MTEEQPKTKSGKELSEEQLKQVTGGITSEAAEEAASHQLGKVQNQNVGGRIAALRAGARGVSAQGLTSG